jgi:D-aspartate ligase
MGDIGAVVIGGHFQGLGVVRALARYGVRVAVIDSEPCLSRFSRYVSTYVRSPNVRNQQTFLHFLKRLALHQHLDGWVVYPTDDETVHFLSRHRDALKDFYRIPTPSWDVIKFVYDKKQSYRLAEKIGIPIPRTYYPKNLDDVKRMDAPFPMIIKPAVMRNFFRITGKKVFRARNRQELEAMYVQASTIIDPGEILIQEEIPDVSHHLYSFCPLFKEKKVLAKIIAKRPRQHPMDFGQASTFAETVDIPVLEILGSRFLSAIDYYGLCEVEFIQDPRDRQFKFLEVNPRIWGWHTIAVRAGVNLPYLLYSDMVERHVKNGYFEEGIKWMRLTTDIPTVVSEVLKGRMKLKDYVRSWKGEKEFAVFSLNDPLPFIGEFFLLPYLWRKRGF